MKKIIVVTGASSGMGREFVKQISQKGLADEIWGIARRKDRLEELEKELPVPFRSIPLDLTKAEDLKKYQALLAKEKPTVRILANCSGFGKLNHYENEPLEVYENMVDLNIKGTMAMVQYSLPFMGKGSKIMNLASCSGFMTLPYINVYASTKAFLLSYSRALNQELAYRGIHVLAVCPCWVRTEFFERAIDPEEKPVVLNYGIVYRADAVIRQAIRDLYSKKDVSLYGTVNKLQVFLAMIMPKKLFMKGWMLVQRLDGTPEIRKK